MLHLMCLSKEKHKLLKVFTQKVLKLFSLKHT